MLNQDRFVMVSPAPGFAARVMTRLGERERARARRRALIGSALLVGAAGVVVLFVALRCMAAGWALITNSRAIITSLNAFGSVALSADKMFNLVWATATAIGENLDPLQMMLGATAVFVLTMFWARVVTDPFQASSSTNHVGGLRK